jgi:hypothetical protein
MLAVLDFCRWESAVSGRWVVRISRKSYQRRAARWRQVDAHWILRRHLFGRSRQLFCRCALWLAGNVLVGGTQLYLSASFVSVSLNLNVGRTARTGGQWLEMRNAFNALFSKEYKRRTLLNSVYLLISIVGLWAGSFMFHLQ